MAEFLYLRRRVLLGGVLLVLALVVAFKLLLAGGPSEVAEASEPLRPLAAAPERAPALVVHVVGAVRRPGLYRVAEGARVADAVRRAGGVARDADVGGVNLAAPVGDGQQVVVPRRVAVAATGPTAAGATAGAPVSGPVQLSVATLEQLDALPGVGPATAAKIIAHRDEHGPFRSVDDLDAVPGIGPARVEQLRDLVVP